MQFFLVEILKSPLRLTVEDAMVHYMTYQHEYTPHCIPKSRLGCILKRAFLLQSLKNRYYMIKKKQT